MTATPERAKELFAEAAELLRVCGEDEIERLKESMRELAAEYRGNVAAAHAAPGVGEVRRYMSSLGRRADDLAARIYEILPYIDKGDATFGAKVFFQRCRSRYFSR